MDQPLASYSFLPYLRQGIARHIASLDHDLAVTRRAAVDINLTLKGEGIGTDENLPVGKKVEIYGPGEIIGIDPRVVVRTAPRDWITNFEPNYMPFVEFYEEDFPWRYTPAAAGADHRLRPWIALVVLAEGEFEERAMIPGRPLPVIAVPNAADLFPPAGQLWAWAHVHANTELSSKIVAEGADMEGVLNNLQTLLDHNPDHAYSRLICPRFLKENTPYHAFIVPTFERGRLAGLNLDPDAAPFATLASWEAYPGGATPDEGGIFPYYYRWYFRTGTIGSFEYLVRLLVPRPMPYEVGNRPVDTVDPGADLPAIDQPGLNGTLRLGGALQLPEETLPQDQKDIIAKFEGWDQDFPHPFQSELAAFVNLADSYTQTAPEDANQGNDLPGEVQNDPDPLITPPLYGRWHAPAERLLYDRDGNPLPNDRNWVHDLNLDPRFRIAAGFGTRVIQQNQEVYMDAAWGQIGEVLAANRKIRQGQFAREVNWAWYAGHLQPLFLTRPDKALAFTAPLHGRLMFNKLTVQRQVSLSLLPRAAISAPARRILRPRARLAASLPFDEARPLEALVTRLNAGEVAAAPPKGSPPGAATVQDIADQLEPANAPPAIRDLLRRYPWLKYLPIALVVLILLLMVLFPAAWVLALGAAAIAGLVVLARKLFEWSAALQQADSLSEAQYTPQAVDALPKSPDFAITYPGEPLASHPGGTDSAEAVRFKSTLKDAALIDEASIAAAARPERRPLDLSALSAVVFTSLDPRVTVRKRVLNTLFLPPRLAGLTGGGLEEIIDYPVIDLPMYDPLVKLSAELFLPNINLIPQNTISLLEPNQRFIESYMVGLNHEFSRELLWREFPSRQNGTFFRQFWDAKGALEDASLPADEQREKLYDIPPMTWWPAASDLGEHNHRKPPGAGQKKKDLVLVVRGELLKKYPTAVVYAHAAVWQKTNGRIDPSKERELASLEGAEIDKPPRSKVRMPLYEARVAPDIYFFGFDLDAVEARGGTGDDPNDPPGWFFVIKERPGEPRFGLDETIDDVNVWNDLSWPRVLPNPIPDPAYLQITPATAPILLTPPPADEASEKATQILDDQKVFWNKDMTAADLAYILYQVPVMVAVHAAEMLAKEE